VGLRVLVGTGGRNWEAPRSMEGAKGMRDHRRRYRGSEGGVSVGGTGLIFVGTKAGCSWR